MARLRSKRTAGLALAAAALSSVAVLAPQAPAGAVTRTVCASGCDHTTIQAAVTAAVNGDVVTVAAGTYHEQVSISQKGITLQGAGSGQTIIDGDNRTDLPIAAQINMQSATTAPMAVKGFTIRNVGRQTGASVVNRYGILVKQARPTPGAMSLDDIVIEGSDAAADTMTGIYVSGASGTPEPDVSLTNSTISGQDGQALLFENWRAGATITGNAFTEGTPSNGPAIFALAHSDGNLQPSTAGWTISGNTFTGAGMSINQNSLPSLTVTGNTFTGLTGTDSAYTSTGTGGSTITVPGPVSTVLTISGNKIVGGGGSTRGIVINASATRPNSSATISNNSITGAGTALEVNGAGQGPVTLSANRISGNTVGLVHGTGGTLTANGNWWGCNSSPVAAAAPCNPVSGAGTTTLSTWVVATAGVDDANLASGGSTDVHSALNTLNDASPFVPGTAFTGTPVAYAANAGSVSPTSGTIAVPSGVGTDSTYTAPAGPGVATVTATVDGFAIPLTVTLDAPAGSGVAGVVTNEVTGQPIAGLQVRIYTGPGYTVNSATTTNALGGYNFTKPAGDYKLWFRDLTNAYTSEYFDEATTLAGATPVSVSGTKVTIDEQLAPKVVTPPVAKAAISGKVTNTVGGGNLAGIQVRLYSATDGFTASSATTTDASGNYTFANRAAGSYKLYFRDVGGLSYVSEYHSNKADLPSADAIALNGTPVVVNAALDPVTGGPGPSSPQSVSGTVTDAATGLPIAGIQVRIYSESSGYASSSATTTDASGNYTFANRAAGSYKLYFRDVSGKTYVSEYHLDKADLASADVISVSNAPVVADAALTPKDAPAPA